MKAKAAPVLTLVYRGLVAASLVSINGCAAPTWMSGWFQTNNHAVASLLPHQTLRDGRALEAYDPSITQLTNDVVVETSEAPVTRLLPHNHVATAEATQPIQTPIQVADTSKPSGLKLKADMDLVSAKRVVFMAYAKTTLGPVGKRAVGEMIPYAKQAERIDVHGFADPSGDHDKNLALARARADHLAAVFIHAGVPQAKVSRDGYVRDAHAAVMHEGQGKSMRGVEVTLVLPTVIGKELPTDIYAVAPMTLKSASELNVALLQK